VTDVIVRATGLRWESDAFPGSIEVVVDDSAGRSHHIVEKVPVLTRADITAASVLPAELWLSAKYQRMEGDDVVVRFDEGVETTEGLDELAVSADNVRSL
jgi:hypothetical protein